MDQIPPIGTDFVAAQQELLREQLAAAWQLHIERVEEQLRQNWQTQLGRIVEERFGEFAGRFNLQVQAASESRTAAQDELLASDARLKWSAQFNQITRRLDQADDMVSWTAALLDGAVSVAPRGFLFSVLSGELVYEGSRAPEGETFPALAGLRLPLDSAPGFQSVVESLDTVISLASSPEISADLVAALGLDDCTRLSLFPIVTDRAGEKRRVAAILATPALQTPSDIPALELLACVAGLSLEVRQAALKAAKIVPQGQLLGIAPATEVRPPVHVVVDVARLTKDDQDLHARAQRFARVHVAELRLYQAKAVKAGRDNRNLFLTLQKAIEADREQYRRDFFSTPTMIDYYHVELVRTLANDDPSMLGPDYPGPLA